MSSSIKGHVTFEAVPQKPSGLAARSLHALKWNYAGSAVRVLSQLGIGIVLARLLGPEPFGLVAIAWLVLGLGNLLSDMGLAAALIQKPQIDEQDIRYTFTLQVLIGLSMSVCVFLLAPLIATFFARPDATAVLSWLSLTFVLQALGLTAVALMRRDLEHRRVQLLQIVSYLTGYLFVGVLMAWLGYGVWALVCAQLVQTLLFSMLAYASSRHAVQPTLHSGQTQLLSFGSKVLLGNLSNWGMSYLDSAVVGRVLGMVELGLYNRSLNLVTSPMNAVVSSLQGVLFPLYARLQNQREQACALFMSSLCVLSLLMLPIFCAVAACAVTTLDVVYGPRWLLAGSLLAPLALAMPFNAMLAVCGPMMQGLGRAGLDAGVQTIGVIVLLVVTVIAARYSLLAVGWAMLGIYIARAMAVMTLAVRMLRLKVFDLCRALAGPLILGGVAYALAALFDSQLANIIPASVARLLLVLTLCAVVLLLLLACCGKSFLCREACELLSRSLPQFPPRVQAVMGKWLGVRLANETIVGDAR